MLGSPRGGLHCRTCGGGTDAENASALASVSTNAAGECIIDTRTIGTMLASVSTVSGSSWGASTPRGALVLRRRATGSMNQQQMKRPMRSATSPHWKSIKSEKADCNERDEKHRGESDADVSGRMPQARLSPRMPPGSPGRIIWKRRRRRASRQVEPRAPPESRRRP